MWPPPTSLLFLLFASLLHQASVISGEEEEANALGRDIHLATNLPPSLSEGIVEKFLTTSGEREQDGIGERKFELTSQNSPSLKEGPII